MKKRGQLVLYTTTRIMLYFIVFISIQVQSVLAALEFPYRTRSIKIVYIRRATRRLLKRKLLPRFDFFHDPPDLVPD